MANPYQSVKRKPSVSKDGINITEWLVIVALLIVITIGYGYYRSYKNAHESAPDQPIAGKTAGRTAANGNSAAQHSL